MRQPIYNFDRFRLDAGDRQLLRDGEPVPLPAKAFDILLALVENRGRLVGKDELFNRIWPGQIVDESNLTVQISTLRKVLGEQRQRPRYIVTVAGHGYRFIGDLRPLNEDPDVVIETETLARVVIESEQEEIIGVDANGQARRDPEEATAVAVAGPARTANARATATTHHQAAAMAAALAPSRRVWLIAIAALVIGALAVSVFYRRTPSNQSGISAPAAAAERQPKIRRLTNNGKVRSTILSPDGKFFAYVLNDRVHDQTSLWLGQTNGGNDVVLRPAAAAVHRVIAFSADSSWLYFTEAEPMQVEGTLYKMPVLGGAPQKMAEAVSTFLTISPDETRMAFVRDDPEKKTSTLVVANLDRSDERELAVRPLGNAFVPSSPSWSADGALIALSAVNGFNRNSEANKSYEVFVVQLSDGGIHQVTALEWNSVNHVEWLKDGSGLVAVGRDKDSGFSGAQGRALWMIDYPSGKVRRITLDLSTYGRQLSLTADSSTLLVLQGQTEGNVWVAPADDLAAARQVTFGSAGRLDGVFGMDWTSDGRIIYVAWIDQSSTLWVMDADGKNARPVTSVGFRDERPCVTADGRYVVFQSNRSGSIEIWRMNLDGSNLQQLTSGGPNSRASVTPDGKWVVYMNEREGNSSIWRVALAGGAPIRITDDGASDPRVSPDGKFVACGYITNGKTRLALVPPEGGAPTQSFDLPRTYNFTDGIRWTPDGQAVTYRDWANGVWRQPLAGGAPERLASLPEEKIMLYGWSRDGKQFAFVRVRDVDDVVLINHFR